MSEATTAAEPIPHALWTSAIDAYENNRQTGHCDAIKAVVAHVMEPARAELAAISAAIGTTRFMDPPDGGEPTLAEQVGRMRERVETLEQAGRELLEVADLRGDTEIPHPCDDPKEWSARMSDAWADFRAALETCPAAAPAPRLILSEQHVETIARIIAPDAFREGESRGHTPSIFFERGKRDALAKARLIVAMLADPPAVIANGSIDPDQIKPGPVIFVDDAKNAAKAD